MLPSAAPRPLLLAVLAISSSLLPAVNRSDMTLDAPCAGSALLLFAVRSQRGQSLAFSARRLLVSTLLKRIDVERPRFLSCFLVMNIFRSGLAALGAFYKIQSGLEPVYCLRKHFTFSAGRAFTRV